MFARIKQSGSYQYLQIVENRREGNKVIQRVIATLGNLDVLQSKQEIENIIRSLSRFSSQSIMALTEQSQVAANTKSIGPGLIFDRLWKELGIKDAIANQLIDRKFEYDVERAVFLTVLHRLMDCGSDRAAEQWCDDYRITGTDDLALHHLYRTMLFLGEELEPSDNGLAPRCRKDLIEESLFSRKADLFSELEMVFFDTTSIYFHGEGGESIGQKGYSKDHRSDLNQMIVGAVIDGQGRPICCEIWPGNTADINTLIPITDRVRSRFGIS
ncbi:MAG: transposase, partial [Candidatus Delongbacteria bacterium]|nr:transposase [Candidatus Delongbacteria bacterium]